MELKRKPNKTIKVGLNDILKEVCTYYNVSPSQALGYNRMVFFVRARHVFFYLSKLYSRLPLHKIGEVALKHGRNVPFTHCTVLHAFEKIKDELDYDVDLKYEVKFISEQLQHHRIIESHEEVITLKQLTDKVNNLEKILEKLTA